MEFSTYSQTQALNEFEEDEKFKNIRKYKPIPLETYARQDEEEEKKNSVKSTKEVGSENPNPQQFSKDEASEDENNNVLLDMSLRRLIEDFVLVWNKIILELLSADLYKGLKEEKTDWWEVIYRRFIRIISVLWVKDRIMHVGFGLIIASFFAYFILVTK
jgi:hypothetical protein